MLRRTLAGRGEEGGSKIGIRSPAASAAEPRAMSRRRRAPQRALRAFALAHQGAPQRLTAADSTSVDVAPGSVQRSWQESGQGLGVTVARMDSASSAPGDRGRDRSHAGAPRLRRVSLRVSEVEFTALAREAATAGLTPSGYLAQAALAVAGAAPSPTADPRRVLLAGVLQASADVHRLVERMPRAVEGHGGGLNGGDAVLDRVTAQAVRATLDLLDEATVALLRSTPRVPR